MINEITLCVLTFGVALLYSRFNKAHKELIELISQLEKKVDDSEERVQEKLDSYVGQPLRAQIQDLSSRICDLTDLKVLVKGEEVKKRPGKIRSEEHRKKISDALKRSHAMKKGKELFNEQLNAIDKDLSSTA